MVYKATVTVPSKPTMHYYGLTEGAFKTRYTQHTKSFNWRKHGNDTELSKYIWKLKDEQAKYTLTWDIAQMAAPYKCGTRRCDVCLTEKMIIAMAEPSTLLNKRAEIVSTCRHRAKFRFHKLKT